MPSEAPQGWGWPIWRGWRLPIGDGLGGCLFSPFPRCWKRGQKRAVRPLLSGRLRGSICCLLSNWKLDALSGDVFAVDVWEVAFISLEERPCGCRGGFLLTRGDAWPVSPLGPFLLHAFASSLRSPPFLSAAEAGWRSCCRVTAPSSARPGSGRSDLLISRFVLFLCHLHLGEVSLGGSSFTPELCGFSRYCSSVVMWFLARLVLVLM